MYILKTNDQKNCPINRIYLFKQANDYPKEVQQQGNFDILDFKMGDLTKGKREYLFSVGSSTHSNMSPLRKGAITVCGKELLTAVTSKAKVIKVKKGIIK